MTLLTAVNEVCDVVGLDRIPVVYGGDSEASYMMLTLANEAGQEIARRADWKRMIKAATVASSPFTLPADWHRLAPGGSVRAADGSMIRPVTNSGMWAIAKSSSVTPYYFFNGSIVLFAPAASAVGAQIDYLSKNWVKQDVGGLEAAAFLSDDDTTLFPQRLLTKNMVWRWKRQKGLAYEDNLAEFEADLEIEANADRGVQ
ncbi:hypothetical protein ACQZ4Z_13025 [Agrobacterium vitis]|uniref:phage adaptor protein n=1 Tax=Agrobacterium vitis TaxID=373 RepID=UPI001571D9D8|nr:hypothetical protein [Agrobacterium vitis]NSZ42837.1 hypothetical protein [Agrobacterium vitis]